MKRSQGKWIAVIFAVVLTTSIIVTPALASGNIPTPGDERSAAFSSSPGQNDGPPGQRTDDAPGHNRGEDANVSIPDLDVNSTIEILDNSYKRLEELEFGESDAEAIQNETLQTINASTAEYRRNTFADSKAVFDYLNDAQRNLATLSDAVDGESEAAETIERAKEDVSMVANVTARLATLEAYELVQRSEGEFENPGQRQKVESALGSAADAIERGDEASVDTEANHYRNAWTQAKRVLDTVEKNTEPELSVYQGTAVERNDTVVVTPQVVITDIRPYSYEEAELTYENGDRETVELVADPISGGTAVGSTEVDIGPDLENRTITVTATASHDPDRSVEETLELSVDEDDVIPERPDPDEYQVVSVTEDDSDVEVTVGGDGLYEGSISVADRTPETSEDYRAGPVVRIENRTAIEDAEVTIPIDDDVDLEDEDLDLSIYTWDPHDDDPWKPVETEIDAKERVATATVDHFSYFSIFSTRKWDDHRSDVITLEDRHVEDGQDDRSDDLELADFVFVVDESGSMSGSRIENARIATERFVAALTDSEQAGLVGYATGSRVIQELTDDHDELNESIKDIRASGSTNTGAGLETGLEELQERGWDNRSSVIILLSDGHTNRGLNPVSVARNAAENDVEISTVGLGSGADEDELREIADVTGGEYYHAETADDLPNTFERVADDQTDISLVDTDDDGIPDAVEEMDLRMTSGWSSIFDPVTDSAPISSVDNLLIGDPLDLDPALADTDGDGLRDDEEVEIEYRTYTDGNETKLEAKVVNVHTHPAKSDTDGDTLSDYEELKIWNTNPLTQDTSNDGFIDPIDPHPTEYSPPPEVRLSSANFKDGVLVAVDDKSKIKSVEGNPYYDPLWAGSKWDTDEATTYDLDESLGSKEEWIYKHLGMVSENDDYSIDFDTHWGAAPEKYYVNVTDEYDNQVSFLVEVDGNGADIAKAGVAVGGTISLPVDGPTAPASALTGALILAGSTTLLIASEQGYFGTTGEVEEVPVDNIHESTERTWETPDGSEIALPTGEIHGRIGNYERGYGWEYIKEATSLTQTAIGNAVQNPDEVIYENGEIRYIIGPGITDDVILSILGGAVVAASHSPAYNDDCGSTINIDNNVGEEGNPDHAIRDGKPIDEVTTLIEVLENPTRIVDGGSKRYYIKQLEPNRVLLVVTERVSSAYQELMTTFTGTGPDNAYTTVENAMDDITDRENDYEIIHDPENGVEC